MAWTYHNPDGHGQSRTTEHAGTFPAINALYLPSGQLASANYGNGLSYSASFNARQQRIDLIVSRTGLNALDFSYNYDANGRVVTITDHAVSGQNRSFGYDGLGRLTTASGPWGAGSYTYDLLNNIRAKQLGAHRVEFEYNADNQVSRARDTRDGNIWRNYSHDARGNVIDNSRLQFTYDRSDQPTAISGTATGSFVYDAHNRRVKQVINGETIYTVYSLSGAILYRDNVTAGEATDYVRMGGRTIARLKNGVATYPHSDHLGSAAAATDASGNLLWREDYTPFGEPRQNPAGNTDDQGFTGHIHDSATGLTYMQARYYDPVIGRFLSNDPVGFAQGGAGFFNRYAYTFNDPINHIDPTGMCGSRIKDENGDNRVGASCAGVSSFAGGDAGGGGRAGDAETRGSSPSNAGSQRAATVAASDNATGRAGELRRPGVPWLSFFATILEAERARSEGERFVYRVYGGASSMMGAGQTSYWMDVNPQAYTRSELRDLYALPPHWGNTLDYYVFGSVDPSAIVYEGIVAPQYGLDGRMYPGGGWEVEIVNASTNVRVIQTGPLYLRD